MPAFVGLAAATSTPALAQTEQGVKSELAAAEADTSSSPLGEKSPWLLAPVFNSNPKLGTSLGVLGGYLHYFDDKSRPSIFALQGQYSTTASIISGAFARTSFDEDRQRLTAGLVYGYVKNDYSDYLGTGVPLQSNARVYQAITRYQYRVHGPWFLGGQLMFQNFGISGETPSDQEVLDILGVIPYKATGAGLVVQGDTRDSDNMPTQGHLINLNNVAYREALGGDADFDLYRIDLRFFVPQGKRNVFAVRQLNHLTSDAPTQARAPVQLRGYKIGQYNGDYMSSIEGEERLRLAERWTATAFAGVACTYGGDQECSDGANVYWAGGAGVQYIVKPKEGIVLNLEYAQGEVGNRGVYLKMGYAY